MFLTRFNLTLTVWWCVEAGYMESQSMTQIVITYKITKWKLQH